ncbi:hypothetical protein KGF57_000094 [Candida theae]|uniref:SGF29 C-terminal domain-containing protein n=1 Tax=Candida theae TaxID=1198502 RepID=A0AAD5BKZ5_9ASCO|nr:uncharacterized protein KGF57_000094 [Candida theae]KAI5968622.1 hypothetical protein KGF57_000094 [Candida theae]
MLGYDSPGHRTLSQGWKASTLFQIHTVTIMSSEVEGNWDIIITSLQDICASNESLPFDSIHNNGNDDDNENENDKTQGYYKNLSPDELSKLKQDIIDHKSNIGTAKRLIDTSMENLSRLIEYLQKEDLKRKQQREKEKVRGARTAAAAAATKKEQNKADGDDNGDDYEDQQEDVDEGEDEGEDYGAEEDETPIASTKRRRASSSSSKAGTPMSQSTSTHSRRGASESTKPTTATGKATSKKSTKASGAGKGGKGGKSGNSGTTSTSGAIGKGKKLKKVGRSYWTSKYNPSEPIYLGSEVAFKLRNRINEWIQCEVVKIIGDGVKFEIRDPEPDENNNPGHTFRANYKEILLIPTEEEAADLINYAYGTKVLARYPDTTTYYSAIVVGHKKDGTIVRLKFDGEEEVNKECEVERRFVLPLPSK